MIKSEHALSPDDRLLDASMSNAAALNNGTSSPMQQLHASATELYALAYRLYEHGNYRKAADIFHVLTRLQSHKTAYWLGLAAAQQMQHLYAAALETYAVAALLELENPYIHFHAAGCCFSMGAIEKGLQALQAAELVANGRAEYTELCAQLALMREVQNSTT